MRLAEFYVPEGCMVSFAQELGERELNNRITGITEDDEIIIEVQYEKDESESLDKLEEILQKLIDELDEYEEEEDEDNEN